MATRGLISQTKHGFSLPGFHLLGVRVDATQIPDVIAKLETWIARKEIRRFVVVANTHVVMEARQDVAFKKMINSADLCVPDGMPLIWCGQLRGHQLKRRVYGPELMITFCRETASKGYRHFLYGGAPEVTNQLVKQLQQSCPGIQIAGFDSPPFRPLTPEEDEEAIRKINDARPDVLWVGLGCPKQERWIFDHRDRLTVRAMVAVGQAFDLLSGQKKPAPGWMSEHGLEWLFRLLQDPRRLWRRYLIYNTKFIYSVSLEFLGIKRFD
jgi:N-acetylglucosaminyldiphosphoundecaprenol N-acetyl-beta-D-mannosaminyltransferase